MNESTSSRVGGRGTGIALALACAMLAASACGSSDAGGKVAASSSGSSEGSGGNGGGETSSGAGAGSGTGGSCTSRPKTGDIPPDVVTVLEAKCWSCHGDPPSDGAPFSLVTYQDLLQPNPLQKGSLIVETMAQAILPDGERPASVSGMPLAPAPALTSAEFTTLSGWLDNCAPPVEPDGG